LASNIQPPGRKLSRGKLSLLIGAIVAAVIIALLYFERIDALYILATLGLVALLVIVATADLEGKNRIENAE
jgi:uncharacterized membrane protein